MTARTVAASGRESAWGGYAPIDTGAQFDALVAAPDPLPVPLRRRLVRAAGQSFEARSVTGNYEDLLERPDLDAFDLLNVLHAVAHDADAAALVLAHAGAEDSLVFEAAARAWNTGSVELQQVVASSGPLGRALLLMLREVPGRDSDALERAARTLADVGVDAVTVAERLVDTLPFPQFVLAAVDVATPAAP